MIRRLFGRAPVEGETALPETERKAVERFLRRRKIDRSEFFREAVRREMARYRELDAVAAGRTQVDPVLLREV
jgi:hypothetical protein